MLNWPNYKVENRLYKQGYKSIAGLDEVGRGAWAGPIVAAAVVLPPRLKIKGLRDSKLLTPDKRDRLCIFIKKNALAIGVGVISERVIDERGIIEANRQAFLEAINKLRLEVDYLLVDGIKIFEYKLPVDFLIRGDSGVTSIAAASVVAKVTRDNILKDYHNKYPQYGFDLHKGYGTRQHKRMLDRYGVCNIHRMSFKPIMESSIFAND
jgi:ribonuclease HII